MRLQRRIRSIRIKNYKAFEGEARLDILPLTLIFGRNASGKSVVTRLPLLVDAALSNPGVHGLPLQTQDFVFGSSLLDLVYGRLPASSVELCVEFALRELGVDGKLELSIGPDSQTRSHQSSRPQQRIYHWAFYSRSDTEKPELRLEWDRDHAQSQYRVLSPQRSMDLGLTKLEFSGIVPAKPANLLAQRNHTQISNDWDAMENLFALSQLSPLPNIAHLGPFRSEFQRFHRIADRLSTYLGARGQHAGEILGSFDRFGQRGVVEHVKAWFLQYLDLELDIQHAGIEDSDLTTLIRARPKGRSAWVNLADVGTGSAHVLPFVVQQSISIASSDDTDVPDLLVCEEPEAHLHPSAQAGLGELAIETALSGRSWVILETHSETLLLRIRRRIAEKKIRPDQVAMYWVDDERGSTELRRLGIEEDGWIKDWPQGIFEEAASEARAMSKANRERKAV